MYYNQYVEAVIVLNKNLLFYHMQYSEICCKQSIHQIKSKFFLFYFVLNISRFSSFTFYINHLVFIIERNIYEMSYTFG